MINGGNILTTKNVMIGRKTSKIAMNNLSLINQINLYDIFSDDDVNKLVAETQFSHLKVIDEQQEEVYDSDDSFKDEVYEKKEIFDKMGLILKLMGVAIDKLNKHKETTIAKGLEWVKSEIQQSVIFKSDESTLKHFETLREGNKDMAIMVNWVEEFSTMNANQKEMLNTIKNKNYFSGSSKQLPALIIKNSYLSNYFTNEKSDAFGVQSLNFDNYNSNHNKENAKHNYITNDPSTNNYINFSEDCVANIEDPSFDIFKLDKEVGRENTLSTVSSFIFISLGLYSIINYSNFENFLEQITKGYSRKNPYHTDLHAADVEQTCFIFLKYGEIKEVLLLNDLDCAAFLISTIIHDFKHPGLNNNFLINAKNEISIRYNDNSVLENFHVSEAFKIINCSPNCNIFSELSKEEYKIMRKRIIECVLATDMTLHNKEYSMIKLKLDTLNDGQNIEQLFHNLDNVGVFNTQQEFLNVLVHTADISNPTKPLNIYQNWVDLVMEEFWLQGDKEKELNLPVSFLCDRKTTKVSAAQVGFMDGIVSPLVQVIVTFFPNLEFLIDNLNTNRVHFLKLKDEEAAVAK